MNFKDRIIGNSVALIAMVLHSSYYERMNVDGMELMTHTYAAI